MEILIVLALVVVFVGVVFGALIRAGLKLDRERRAQNNQDLADRIARR